MLAGLAAAAALVLLALALRPALVGGTPGLAVDAPAALGSAPVPAPDAGGAATPAAEIAVRLRLGPAQTPAQRDALRAAAEAAGYASVEIREMPYPVDRSRIQFYAPADQPAAEALARALAPVAGGLVELRDLGPIAGPDEAGTIDAWLAADPVDGE